MRGGDGGEGDRKQGPAPFNGKHPGSQSIRTPGYLCPLPERAQMDAATQQAVEKNWQAYGF